MTTPTHALAQLVRLARYNAWAYARLLAAADALPDVHYRAHAGLAFRSVHGTLCHLLVSDAVWLNRLRGEHDQAAALGRYWHEGDMYAAADSPSVPWEDIEPDRTALRRRLLDQANDFVAFLESLPADTDPEGPFSYRTTSGTARTKPLAVVIAHIVNHGTHHRGQASAAVTRFGLAPPSMDLIYWEYEDE
ncbi:hypothetical protein HK105_206685 [Polyrhizophydium stewartii]|uniref:Damage-inducible protein DinB n=1 Tax=Polyrhizophydium stewartii TaxID=2732419 RepID=A0ABR4N2N3_9FUNG